MDYLQNLELQKDLKVKNWLLIWILNYSDGKNDLFDISIKSMMSVELLYKSAKKLMKKKLLRKETGEES